MTPHATPGLIEHLLLEALELPAGERVAFARRRCGADSDSCAEVLGLLAAHERAADFLVSPLLSDQAESAAAGVELLGRAVDGFEIREVLGVGGMGIVYRAEQRSPRREVALKVLLPGLSANDERRLEREAAILARLHHRGIAQVFQAGTFDIDAGRRFYFAMELIQGPNLLEFVGGASLRGRIEAVAEVCAAVQHAHDARVIHRDLKPSNVLIDDPAGAAQPKVLDFGIALTTDAAATRRAAGGCVEGTLAYMSPEQAAGSAAPSARADVYSLGAILYEVLSGSRPLALGHRTIPEALRTIAEQEPPWLGTFDRRFRGDLEAIAGRALAKEPERRYASAAELADDLRRYLAGAPVRARRPTAAYFAAKFLRRHPAPAALALLLVLCAAAFGGYALRTLDRVRAADRQAKLERYEAELSAGLSGLLHFPQEALQHLEAARAEQPDSAEALVALGLAHLRLRAPARALELIDAAPGDVRTLPEVVRVRAHALRDAGRGAEADAVERGLPASATDLDAFVRGWRELQHGSAGDPEVARAAGRAFRQAILWSPRPRAHYFHFAGVAAAGSRDVDLVRDYVASIESRQSGAESEYWCGLLLSEIGDKKEALEFLERAIELRPSYYLARVTLGQVRCALGDAVGGVAVLREAVELRPERTEGHFELGNACALAGDQEGALAAFREAIRLDPDQARFHFNCSTAHVARGDLAAAALELEAALALAPDDAKAHCNLGVVEFRRGNPAAALERFARAQSLDPKWIRPVGNRVLVALAAGQIGAAAAARAEYVELVAAGGHDDQPVRADLLSDAVREHLAFAAAREELLSALVRGEAVSASAAELTALADHCGELDLAYRAALCDAAALGREPDVPCDEAASRRLRAARSAAIVARGDTGEQECRDAEVRDVQRRRSRGWLEAELLRLRGEVAEGAVAPAEAARRLADWLGDGKLAGIRDDAHLAPLPPEQREPCQALWRDVRAAVAEFGG